MVSVLRGALRAVVGLLLVASAAQAAGDERGWGFLVDKLVADGVPRDRVLSVFRDERVDEFDGLHFSLQPRESHALYRPLRTGTTAAKARRCLATYEPAFTAAERTYGVPAEVVASIIQVESGCGANTGRSRILPGLARLAMANEPRNVEANIDRLSLLRSDSGPMTIASFTRWRAQYLEDVFYPEVKAAFEVADRLGVHPLDMRGSGSGAFGIPQFLPRSYLWYGVDGDGDGHVSLWRPEDAIPSCARYLQQYGWRDDLTPRERRNVIWGYNRSDAYIDTVLWLADEVESPSPAPSRQARKAPARKRTATARRPAKKRGTATVRRASTGATAKAAKAPAKSKTTKTTKTAKAPTKTKTP
jgi:membrane-bound lytic murein transglycosylase B